MRGWLWLIGVVVVDRGSCGEWGWCNICQIFLY